MKKTLLILLTLALAGAALSQGGGRGGRGGQFGMRGGGGLTGLTRRADVLKEIGATDEQKSKLEAMREKQQEEMRARFEAMRDQAGGNGGPPDREAMQKEMREREAKSNQELAAILDAGQIKRLKELNIQRAGNRAITRPDVQTELGITEAQKAKMQELMNKQMEAGRALFEKAQNGEMDREQMREISQKNEKIMSDELGKILTDAQRAKLKEMGGKPFTFEADEDRP